MTLATFLPEITGAMADLVPDFAIYATAGVVFGLAILAVRKVVKGLR